MRLVGFTVLALLVSAAAADGNQTEGGVGSVVRRSWDFTRAFVGAIFSTYETAPYTTTARRESYEVREYPSQQWVCTSDVWRAEDETDDSASSEENDDDDDDTDRGDLFMKLFGYISGKNERRQKIEMTTPVTMLWEPQEAGSHKVTMCFWIPSEHQQDAPAPTDADVFIERRPGLQVISLEEGGYPSQSDWERMARRLKEDSIRNNDVFDYSTHYTVGYDAPFKFWNRRNEVWYTKPM